MDACTDAVLNMSGKERQVASSGNDNDCNKKMYHPTSATLRECSNNDSYPSWWLSSADTRNKYFFAVGDDCCANFYSGGPCEVVNSCSLARL